MNNLQKINAKTKTVDKFEFDAEIAPKELQIRRTKNYDQFLTVKGNRKVKLGHVNNLIKMIARYNLLPQFVGVVTNDGYLIDGQHRKEAAKANDLWFYFTIIPENIDEIIVALVNSVQLRWRPIDWINFFADRKYSQYVWIRKIMQEYNLGINQLVYLLKGRIDHVSMRTGKLSFFTTEEEKAYCYNLINEYLDLKQTFELGVWSDADFLQALRVMFQQVTSEDIKNYVERWGKIIPIQNHDKDYLRLFEQILNKGKQEKNHIRFF